MLVTSKTPSLSELCLPLYQLVLCGTWCWLCTGRWFRLSSSPAWRVGQACVECVKTCGGCQALERSWKAIREEVLAVMDQKTGLFMPEEENLRERGEWGQYTLWQQGAHTQTHTHTVGAWSVMHNSGLTNWNRNRVCCENNL